MIFGSWADTLVVDGHPRAGATERGGPDREVESAAVIADRVWAASLDTAAEHVLGYTVFNDLSARRKLLETAQFTLGKNADRSGLTGPVAITPDELGDPYALQLRIRVNGELMRPSGPDGCPVSVVRPATSANSRDPTCDTAV